MILHNYVFVAGSTNPGCCFTWCFRRFCHVVGFLDFRLLRFCLSTANRNWSWNPIGQGSRSPSLTKRIAASGNEIVVARTQARSIQPKFPEISVQNSMDQFGPTGKVSKKLVQLLRWNYGWIVVEWIAPVVRSRRILNSLLTTQLTTDWLPRAGFQPFLREFDGTDNLFPFLCLARVFIGWIAV